MSRRRRRANDFTDTINSFQCSEIDSDTLYSVSQDSLDESKIKNNPVSRDVTRSSKHSTILAGSSSKHSFVQNTSISSTVSLDIQPAPDLNKRIDLFQVEQPCFKIDDYKENNNPQCSVMNKEIENGDAVRNSPSISKKQILASHNKLNTNSINEKSTRDSNYNIHSNKSNEIVGLEKTVPETTSTAEINPICSCTNKDKQTNSEDKCVNNETKKFETVLCSLDNQLNQMKEVSQSQFLKRLSDHFMHAPKNFTEKLLTIIEESVINNDDDICDTSAINLSRLTTEFRKMCKFIEDESDPEWPDSPMATPPCQLQVPKSSICNKSIKVSKNEKIDSPTNTSAPITPISGLDVLRKRFFNKISKNNCNGSIGNIINESGNTSFEQLEAQCKRLFPEEKEHSKPVRRSMSMPSLLSMSQIQNICEQQMAALNISNIDENQKGNKVLNVSYLSDTCLCPGSTKSKLNCSKLKDLHNSSKNMHNDNVSYSMKRSKKITERSDFNIVKPDKFTSTYASFNPDELEKTLLQDIAEKRKRCLDTARLITEINADPEAIEAHKTLKMSPMFTDDNESNSLTHDETKFLKTLMSCKDYQTYLEKQKPFFKLLQNSNPCTPETSFKDLNGEEIKCIEKEASNVKRTPNTRNATLSPNVKPPNLHKSPLLIKRCEVKKEKAEGARSKLFVTPGRAAPSKNSRQKKEYFPNMYSPGKNTTGKNILKSPHAEGLYRLNYNTILSPVGMYIRGTDMQLVQNVRAKTDKLFLTPVKDSAKASPSRNSGQNSQSKRISKTQGKAALKFNLSPKVDKNHLYIQEAKSPENYAPKNHFILPKVSYKMPLQVKTIKENESPKQGTRVKKLLDVAQSKVVIRHEARANSVRTGKNRANDEVYEINYAPEDESIHIEQAASKTNFICKPRYM